MKCKTKHCRKPRAPKRRYCWSCIKRAYANRHPENYAYQTLRQNARQRGKTFSLTLDQFKKFARRTNYMSKRGTGKHGMHIDRIEETKGYTEDNIQPLGNSKNVKKYLTYTINERGKPSHFRTHVEKELPADDQSYPF